MIHGTNATGQDDEATGDEVAEPDAKPRLPPRETLNNHGRGNHPRVHVESVGDPEAHKVPWSPLTALFFDGFQIVVCELLYSFMSVLLLFLRS